MSQLFNSGADSQPSDCIAAVVPAMTNALKPGVASTLQVNPDYAMANVVVIDDEPAVTRAITKVLSDAGFANVQPFTAPNDALEFIERNGVDAVLLDLRIPEIDGISVLNILRSCKKTQYVPVIILTSANDDSTRLRALAAGANGYLVKPVVPGELIQRVKNALYFKHYADQIERQIEEVEKELRYDSLTGIYNRRAFDEHFGSVVQSSSKNRVSLILFDIDQFKGCNDTYGHQAGDIVLRRIAEIASLRCQSTDFLARIGGDEFAIVCEHSQADWPLRLAEDIRADLSMERFTAQGASFKTSISMGISRLGPGVPDRGKLFTDADNALYQSKRQGRNTINVYSDAGAVSIGHEHLVKVNALEDNAMPTVEPHQGRILVIDDEVLVTKTLKLQLNKSGYPNVEVENQATHAVERVTTSQPDLVILDIRMEGANGLEILDKLKENPATSTIPVLIMTSTNDERVRMASLKLQASDFLTKPTHPTELEARVYNSLKLKLQHDQLRTLSECLRHEVDIRTSELFATRRETILCLARAAETRDTETGNHVIRVGHYAAIIARRLNMDEDYVGWIELAAQLHDVGKLAIPDSILHKPGRLNSAERSIVERHCNEADRIFFGREPRQESVTITSPLLRMAARIASTHHEKWDGTGYPNAMIGEQIPIEGRITAVADVFDALSSKRHYKEAFDLDVCFQIIEEKSGSHFDPTVVEAFLQAKQDIIRAKEQWQDNIDLGLYQPGHKLVVEDIIGPQ